MYMRIGTRARALPCACASMRVNFFSPVVRAFTRGVACVPVPMCVRGVCENAGP